jgi:hypothetical protein
VLTPITSRKVLSLPFLFILLIGWCNGECHWVNAGCELIPVQVLTCDAAGTTIVDDCVSYINVFRLEDVFGCFTLLTPTASIVFMLCR